MTPRPTQLLSAASPSALALGDAGAASLSTVQVVPTIAANSPACESVEVPLIDRGAAEPALASEPVPAAGPDPAAAPAPAAEPVPNTTPTGSFAINGLARWPASQRWRALLNRKLNQRCPKSP